MNHSITYRHSAEPEALQARFALRVVARLDEHAVDWAPA